MKTKIFLVSFLMVLVYSSEAQRILVSGTKFLVDDKEIIMNGANTLGTSGMISVEVTAAAGGMPSLKR